MENQQTKQDGSDVEFGTPKDIFEAIRSILNTFMEEEFRKGERAGFEKGRQMALKEMPHWKADGFHPPSYQLTASFYIDGGELYWNGYVMKLADLERLPKDNAVHKDGQSK